MLAERCGLNTRKSLAVCVYINTAIAVTLSLYFFVVPAGELAWDLRDTGLRGGEIPRFAFRWHRALSPKYEAWARDRVRSGKVQSSTADIAGTEWPLFGSVFYLWATEALQEVVEQIAHLKVGLLAMGECLSSCFFRQRRPQ